MKSMTIQCLGYSLNADLYDNNSDIIMLCLNGRNVTRKSFGYMIEALVKRTGFDALHFDSDNFPDNRAEILDSHASGTDFPVYGLRDDAAIVVNGDSISFIGSEPYEVAK